MDIEEKPLVYFKKDKGAKEPNRGRSSDIAHDMYTNEDAFILPNRIKATVVPSGIHTAFDATKYGLFISPRSGIMKYPVMLANSTGLIEGEYRGDIGFPLRSTLSFGLANTASNILTIDETGSLTSLDTKEFFENSPNKVYDSYIEELNNLIHDLGVLFGKNAANSLYEEYFTSKNRSGSPFVPSGTFFLPKGIRIAQAYLIERKDTQWIENDDLPASVRGANGYGSSGAY